MRAQNIELIAALPANGVAFLNCSDAYVSQFGRDFSGKAVYFGVGPCADPQVLDIREDVSGLHVHFRAGERESTFTLHLLGSHNASNAMAGLAVALEAGVPLDGAVAALESLRAGNKRGEILEIAGATILNDSYNSNPEALQSMIHTLATRPAQRRILVAGEMLELGEHASMLHAACGKTAADAGIDLVVGVRGNAQHLAAAACLCGVASVFLPDAAEAGAWLVKNLQPGDVVLVKGSRGVQLERAIEILKNHIASTENNESPQPSPPLQCGYRSAFRLCLSLPRAIRFCRPTRHGSSLSQLFASSGISTTWVAKTWRLISSSRRRATF